MFPAPSTAHALLSLGVGLAALGTHLRTARKFHAPWMVLGWYIQKRCDDVDPRKAQTRKRVLLSRRARPHAPRSQIWRQISNHPDIWRQISNHLALLVEMGGSRSVVAPLHVPLCQLLGGWSRARHGARRRLADFAGHDQHIGQQGELLLDLAL